MHLSRRVSRAIKVQRHAAICVLDNLSEGQVNIFNLAENDATSVDQIGRFYARNRRLSREMAVNLQSFGSGAPDQD